MTTPRLVILVRKGRLTNCQTPASRPRAGTVKRRRGGDLHYRTGERLSQRLPLLRPQTCCLSTRRARKQQLSRGGS